MTKEQFDEIIYKIQDLDKKYNLAFESGVDLMSFMDGHSFVVEELFNSIFGLEKTAILYWYLYEYREGQMKIYDHKTSKVLYDFDKEGDLWKYMNDKGEPPF